ncbi:protein kinase domain protein [Talaromyces pinophilus]|uniref:Protein kinase domain protein n=1 Tax=Talaromyces pinophilus TaxID=128442 RepID=A0A6V8HGE2_TALPI|nr:protein kinase domain protein [Talaromyces pinophilus]
MATTHFTTPLAVDTLQTPRRKTLSTPPDTPVSNNNDSDNESPALKNTGRNTTNSKIIEFPYDLEIARDSNGAYIEFGRGVWSIVYKATSNMSTRRSMMMMMTPPSSPVISTYTTTSAKSSRVVAVKTPLRRDAYSILRAEAYILSRITSTSPTASDGEKGEGEGGYVVPFYGYIPSSHALVLQALPLSLSTHIETCADQARKSFSTRTMFDPVTPNWRGLATQLIKGLDWLHTEVGVVHGDIKPHNILLRPRQPSSLEGGEMEYDALYADFSSAHFISSPSSTSNSEEVPTGEGALTPPFSAPELLTLSAMKSSSPLTTPASDIFALALTLLAAATGDVLVYSGTSAMQRLAMSREGWRALDYVRSGANASRLGRGRDGFVGRVVQRGICREVESRATAGEWLDMFA